jgi:hypothetical protein
MRVVPAAADMIDRFPVPYPPVYLVTVIGKDLNQGSGPATTPNDAKWLIHLQFGFMNMKK